MAGPGLSLPLSSIAPGSLSLCPLVSLSKHRVGSGAVRVRGHVTQSTPLQGWLGACLPPEEEETNDRRGPHSCFLPSTLHRLLKCLCNRLLKCLCNRGRPVPAPCLPLEEQTASSGFPREHGCSLWAVCGRALGWVGTQGEGTPVHPGLGHPQAPPTCWLQRTGEVRAFGPGAGQISEQARPLTSEQTQDSENIRVMSQRPPRGSGGNPG